MKITVIIPTYKPQDYLWECLESLNKQTLSKDQWELVLVLNGCKDPWMSQIENYLWQHKMSNAHLIQIDEPGVSNARNIGIENAKGEYITFIDDDDYISPAYIEKLSEIADTDTIAASDTIAYNDSEGCLQTYYIKSEYDKWHNKGILPYYKPRRYLNVPYMKLIHRSIINDERYDIRFKNGEDSLFMFAISKNMKYIRFTGNEAIYYRRIRQGSASHNNNLSYVLQNSSRIIAAYSHIYFSDIFSYNFQFYITRILGTIHNLINIHL